MHTMMNRKIAVNDINFASLIQTTAPSKIFISAWRFKVFVDNIYGAITYYKLLKDLISNCCQRQQTLEFSM